MNTNKQSIRIVEIRLYRSKKNPRFGHAVATLFPCNHKRHLGIARMKGTERSFLVQDVTIWTPFNYSVAEKVYCKNCPDLFELVDLSPTLSEIEDSETGIDFEDDL